MSNSIEDYPLTLRVPQAMQVLGVSRNTMYKLCKEPGFPARKFGNLILIPRDALAKWMDDSYSA